MIIGLTYDLRSEYLAMGYSEDETAEFDRDDTITALEDTLRSLGHRTDRIGTGRKLTERLAAGDRWDMVFNIAEGLSGSGREAQVPAILDLYGIPYTFSDPLVMSLTLHKGMTKRILRDNGIPTSDFVVVEYAADDIHIPFSPPYFIKPVAEGTGKGVSPASIIRQAERVKPACAQMIDVFRQPVLLEPYLPGREFTVGIIGTGKDAVTLGTMEVLLGEKAEAGVYSYVNKEQSEERVTYRLVPADADITVKTAEEVSLEAWRALGCRDGGRIDLRCDEKGNPLFMEVNPLAGLHPEHSDLPILCGLIGISYRTLIERILSSAMSRIPASKMR
ncbi:MAG: D-alanine--D-alanine ligase [Desulfobacterales bacterium]|nr:D-alanine--D-alanine ligase [Desulfobacterales bacterium]